MVERQCAMTAAVLMFCDGLCEPVNPGGFACWGWVAFDETGHQLAQEYGCLGHGPGMTNNRAEYTALLQALDWATAAGHQGVHISTDSKLVVEQTNGRWNCKSPALQPLCATAQQKLARLQATLSWVPREQNTAADTLTRTAYADAQQAATGAAGGGRYG